jgi:6-phosphogluconolactonase
MGELLRAFKDREALTAELSEMIAQSITNVAARDGVVRLALSGGSTPAPLYRALAARQLPWSKVDLALVDERWVAPDHEASNERLVRDCFAPALAAGARFTPMKTDAGSPREALAVVEPRYAALRPFDIVVLGMGLDGHAASWFPGAEGLEQALDRSGTAMIAAIRAIGSSGAGAYIDRMTLTRRAVMDSGWRVLVIVGAEKRAALERAVRDGLEADAPVTVLFRSFPLDTGVFWAP